MGSFIEVGIMIIGFRRTIPVVVTAVARALVAVDGGSTVEAVGLDRVLP
jgi:hypothetical protein